MAKYLLWLSLSLLGTSNVWAYCYYSQTANGLPVLSSIGTGGALSIQQCQALACQIWPNIQGCPGTAISQPACTVETQTQVLSCPSGYNGTITQTKTKSCPANVWGDWITTSNTCVSTCVPVSETQTQSCPANYSGSITQTRTKTCPDNQWQAWQTTQNTCVANPPTCQISSQTQTLSCQTGYTGSITQTRSSTCPDPYGQPVWQPWATTSDSCVKSITNVTNPASPVSPLNPASPASSISAPITPSSPVTVQTPMPVQSSVPTPTAAPEVKTEAKTETKQETKVETKTDAPTTTASPTTSTTSTSRGNQSQGPRLVTPLGLALSLELFVKPGLTQPSLFPTLTLVQPMPIEMVMQDSVMGLMFQPTINQYLEPQDLGFEQ